MPPQKRHKALNFDLDSEKLRTVFGGENGRRKAYAGIERFLTKNGFEHRQWSGYASTKPMSYYETYTLIGRLVDECPWMAYCVNRFDATNIMSESDMLEAIRNHESDQQMSDKFTGMLNAVR
jgi:virulence-associated protein VapD